MTSFTMPADASGDPRLGERKIAQKNRRRWIIFGGLALAGFIPGMMLGRNDRGLPFGTMATLPAWLAILLAVAFVLAVAIGGWLLCRQMDELELRNKRRAASAAGSVLMLVYPAWLILWMGDLVPEPIHWLLFATFYVTLIGYELYYRYKS